MVNITLDYGYEIKIDRYNHTLVKKQLRLHRDGSPASVVKQTIGYYPDITSCINRYLQDCNLLMIPEDAGSLKEYAELVQQCNADTASYITRHTIKYDQMQCNGTTDYTIAR